MLSALEQKDIWERWLASEMRANYFGDLAGRYAFRQSLITWLTLLSTSGAAFSLVTDWVPPSFGWIKPALAFFAAGLSLLNVTFQNQKRSVECSELQFRWNRLASDYEALWNNMYGDEAHSTLAKLKEKSAELSKSSMVVPYSERVMSKWENYVIEHRVTSRTPATA